MMKLKRAAALLMAAAMCLTLAACGSDYPVVDRKLDVSELFNAAFEDTGYDVEIEDAIVTVSAVADRMSIDMDASAETVESIRSSVKSATLSGNGIYGVWHGKADVAPFVCGLFSGINGLDLNDYIKDVEIPYKLTFTHDGFYILEFDSRYTQSAEKQMLSGAAKATKAYFSEHSDGVASVAIKVIDDSSLENALKYVVQMAIEMIENGRAGTCTVKDGVLSFDGNGSCRYSLIGGAMDISQLSAEGLLSSIGPDARLTPEE